MDMDIAGAFGKYDTRTDIGGVLHDQANTGAMLVIFI
jgi:hypothetical protein